MSISWTFSEEAESWANTATVEASTNFGKTKLKLKMLKVLKNQKWNWKHGL